MMPLENIIEVLKAKQEGKQLQFLSCTNEWKDDNFSSDRSLLHNIKYGVVYRVRPLPLVIYALIGACGDYCGMYMNKELAEQWALNHNGTYKKLVEVDE